MSPEPQNLHEHEASAKNGSKAHLVFPFLTWSSNRRLFLKVLIQRRLSMSISSTMKCLVVDNFSVQLAAVACMQTRFCVISAYVWLKELHSLGQSESIPVILHTCCTILMTKSSVCANTFHPLSDSWQYYISYNMISYWYPIKIQTPEIRAFMGTFSYFCVPPLFLSWFPPRADKTAITKLGKPGNYRAQSRTGCVQLGQLGRLA